MRITFFVFFLLMTGCLLTGCQTRHAIVRTSVPVKATDSVWDADNITAFENRLEALRRRYHIPGLSAGIVNGGQLVWKKGFGYADVEGKLPPDENTVYQIASVTKTFGAVILMQQVEAGRIHLDDPIARYGINLGARWGSDERIRIKHLLTHTAMGNSFNAFKPGYTFRYNGGWYNQLGKVIEKASGHSFGELLLQNIVQPLGLARTVPSTDDSASFRLTGYSRDSFMRLVAKPYDWQYKKLVPVKFSYGFGPAAGMESSVADLAVYARAIDEKRFLDSATWKKVFTPFVTVKGKTIQYGLGWFIKDYKGVQVIWHTGWWTGYSALFVRIPQKDLTFIILANSQDLSRPFYHVMKILPMFNPFRNNLNKDLFASAFAKAFMEHFTLP
ncbi:serine hydrolase [Chitinophaga sp. HK235]|uniref:serine hydrolase domain-containing protein n=1 Tax=Chitinophaga sp. HK235 TaxID=2952571 RepID=UPI001BA88DF9|nr:serine hydrolase domain-containing protein [Chitinophaga sp. HK235]